MYLGKKLFILSGIMFLVTTIYAAPPARGRATNRRSVQARHSARSTQTAGGTASGVCYVRPPAGFSGLTSGNPGASEVETGGATTSTESSGSSAPSSVVSGSSVGGAIAGTVGGGSSIATAVAEAAIAEETGGASRPASE